MSHLLGLAVALPLLLGMPAAAWVGRANSPGRRRAAAWIAGGVALASLALVSLLAPAVLAGQVLLWQQPWLPEIGLTLGFRLDGLALMFVWLITGIGALVVLYAAYYLHADDPAGKFYAQFLLFMAAMLGVVMADNLLLLVVFWELTSISSFLLVGYWGHRADARAGARMALAVTGGGGLALLAGIILLGQIAGTYELSQMLDRGQEVRAHALYPVALVLVLLGCFTKSAQLPFHFWLPEAMAAPTPVSAYLHSATMVKAGVFLLARLYPVIGGSTLFELIVAGAGLATLLFAAYVAVFRHDLKGLLAYSTISHLGLITFLIGLGSPLSAVAAVFHILNHATFKASLFMTAGIIDHETGTRDMRQLGGLLPYLPWTATLAMVAAASMAGVPLANGFLSKEMFFGEALTVGGTYGWLVPVVATLAGVCSVAYSLRFIHDVFFAGPLKPLPNPHPHEPPFFMKAPVGLLVVVCLVVGVLPAATVGPLVAVAAAAVLNTAPPAYHLALWHGFNLPLLMSVIALGGGVLMYAGLKRHYNLHLHHPNGFTGRLLFTHAFDGLLRAAGRLTAFTENGSLQRYMAWMLGTAVVLAAWPLFGPAGAGLAAGERPQLPATPLAWLMWGLLMATGAALLALHRQRFIAVVLVGAVGLVTALTFEALSAPDLALTQLAVEVVSTVLLLMGLALLPATTPRESSVLRRSRDALLAAAGGGGMAWLAWLVLTRNHDSISWFFAEQSLPAGGGTNAVNVILVDFRGYDTFGEITVLGIAAVGALALLDGMRARRPRADDAGRAWSFARPPLMLQVVSRLVLLLALVVSAYIFWRGHNLPGGGFVAGLVTAAALLLQYMARGQGEAEARLGGDGARRFTRWIAIGLGIALCTGAGAFLFGQPFFTSAHGHPSVPLLGELPLATAGLFDLGVYVTVVGATMLMLSSLGSASKQGASA
ncbi:monovalent cation/H+ antiporter subunit A [Aquincola tertiaricarbonis]|uniref:monovalent cation/H+ antiporter subunit A n=1 Tax=Aquincola tertiaricarbonis TaxID=391953 RepID=UPI000698D9F0|nr:monovalent cation/H+ antiporter subunit A [Aquincola tertiaricarbonis]